MKRFMLFIFFIILSILPLYSATEVYEKTFPLEYIERYTYVSIDEEVELTDPLDMIKAHAGVNAGTSPVELYANMIIRVIWDSDSVIQGDSLTLRIVTDIEASDEPTIYTNYGVAAGAGVDFRMFGPLGGPWVGGPGYGIDFNFNIESEDDPPSGPGDDAKGDDVVDFLSLVPDLGGGSGTKGFAISPEGDTLYLKDGSTGSDVMGLFDILSLRLNAGLKSSYLKKLVRANPDYMIFHGTDKQWDYSLLDTFYYTVYVDSFVPANTMGYIEITQPRIQYDLYRRIGLCLQSFGFTIASSYWFDEDFYEFLGIRELSLPYQYGYNESRFTVPVKVVGQPILNPDLFVAKTWVFSRDTFGNAVEFTEAGVPTEIPVHIMNMGSSHSDTTIMKVAWEDSVKYYTIDPLNFGYGTEPHIWVTFSEPGEHMLHIIPNYDQSCDESNFANNDYGRKIKVVPKSKQVFMVTRDETSSPFGKSKMNEYTVLTSFGVDTLSCINDTLWAATVPSGENVLFSFTPDTTYPDYYYTVSTVNTDTIPTSGFVYDLEMQRMAVVDAAVYDPKGDPVDSATVQFSAYSEVSETGSVTFDRVAPIPADYNYSLHVSHPLFKDLDTIFTVQSGGLAKLELNLKSTDSIPPAGTMHYTQYVKPYGLNYMIGAGMNIGVRFTATDDYSGMSCVDIINKDEGIPHRFYFANQGEDTTLYVEFMPDQPAGNNWARFNYVFYDLGGNPSILYRDSVIVNSDGPAGSFYAIEDTTYSGNVACSYSAVDTLCSVRRIHTGIIGGDFNSFLYDGAQHTITLPASDGIYELFAVYENEFGIFGDTITDSVNYIDVGVLIINNNDIYTKTHACTLIVQPKALSTGIMDMSGGISQGGYPTLQTFVPNTDRIRAVSVNFSNCDSMDITMAVFTDSTNGIYDHIPGTLLSQCTVFHDSADGWYYGILDSVISVIPSDTYQIVIFRDSLTESFVPFTSVNVDDARYADGTCYYSPTMNDWYSRFLDMAFKVYSDPDSLWVSNVNNFSTYSKYTTETVIPWTISSGQGEKMVYSKSFFGGTSPGTMYDGIFIDSIGPVITAINVNDSVEFTIDPLCTLQIEFTDNYSEYAMIDINNGEFQLAGIESGYRFAYPYADSSAGTKNISIKLCDNLLNWGASIDTFIDYDPDGIPISPYFNTGTRFYISSRFPTMYINTAKSITPVSMRYSEDYFNMGAWVPFASGIPCTLNTDSPYHLMRVEVTDNYGQISVASVSAYVDSTSPPAVDNVYDEGAYDSDGILEFSWTKPDDDPESKLDETAVILENATTSTQVSSISFSPSVTDTSFTGTFAKYNSYIAKVTTYNNAGLNSGFTQSDGIIIDNLPDIPVIISPAEGDSTGTRPVFLINAYDGDTDTTLCFKIDIAEDSLFSSILRTFNGKTDAQGWDKTRYCTTDTARFTVPSADSLLLGNTYYFRVMTYDSVAASSYSQYSSFIINYPSGIMPDFNLSYADTVLSAELSSNILTGPAIFRVTVPGFCNASINIIDAKGAVVKNLLNTKLNPGGYYVKWDCTDKTGRPAPSGNYFAMFRFDDTVIMKKVQKMQ